MDVSKFTIGRPVRIKTDDDIYDSYISAITLSDENFVYFKSGSLRITLLDKLKSDKNETGNKLDVTGGTIKGDLTVNKQIYMGDSRVLNYDDLYYKSGDNITLSYSTGGYLTTGGTEIAFSIPLPKRMNNVTPTIESGKINVRKPEGGYLLNNVSITENNAISFIKTENLLTIRLIYNEAFSDIPNNTALAIQAMNVKINFS